MSYACPGCNVPEGALHERGCPFKPIGVRPCCGTPIWPDSFVPHESTCPSWGDRPIHEWQYPSFAFHGDPWRDVTWS